MSLELDEHRHYLRDRHRIEAFSRALTEVVRPGDTVVDLGAGTGILGLLALKAGAAHVYAIDAGPIIGLARQIAAANGLDSRITWVRELSTRASLPSRVDLLVTDQIGRFGFDAGVVEFLRDARRRLLKPDGRTVPLALDMHGAPVEHARRRRHIEFWRRRPAGFDYAPARQIAINTGYPSRYTAGQLLADPAPLGALDLTPDGKDCVRHRASFTIGRNGRLDGVGAWFRARLSPSVVMTNDPTDPQAISRRQVFLPIAESVPVEAGARVEVSLTVRPDDVLVFWTVRVWPRDCDTPRVFSHSTLNGMLLSADDLRRQRPDWVPVLTQAGAARQSVLDLCDGRRSLDEIEREMQRRHPDLLPDDKTAGAFVAETLSVYAR